MLFLNVMSLLCTYAAASSGSACRFDCTWRRAWWPAACSPACSDWATHTTSTTSASTSLSRWDASKSLSWRKQSTWTERPVETPCLHFDCTSSVSSNTHTHKIQGQLALCHCWCCWGEIPCWRELGFVLSHNELNKSSPTLVLGGHCPLWLPPVPAHLFWWMGLSRASAELVDDSIISTRYVKAGRHEHSRLNLKLPRQPSNQPPNQCAPLNTGNSIDGSAHKFMCTHLHMATQISVCQVSRDNNCVTDTLL